MAFPKCYRGALNLIEQNFDIPIFAIKPTDTASRQVYNQITKVTETLITCKKKEIDMNLCI